MIEIIFWSLVLLGLSLIAGFVIGSICERIESLCAAWLRGGVQTWRRR